jgi:hypothetical protein
MNPDAIYHMQAQIIGDNNQVWIDQDQIFTTGSLPKGSIASVNVLSKSSGVNEGIDLISDLGSDIGAVAFDHDGSVLWYYYDPHQPHLAFPLRQLANGHFLAQVNNDVREVDLEGNVVRELTLDQLNASLISYGFQVASFHHDLLELDNGHLILLVNEWKLFCDIDVACTYVLGDALVDVDRDNNVRWVWRAFDHLDIHRHPYLWPDWTHCNAVVYLPDGNLLLSSRHQSWVMKISYMDGLGDGEVLWRFGPEGDFTLTPNDPTEWQWNQHYPVVLSVDGSKMTLMLYDNGNQRPYEGKECDLIDGACYSRGVIFDLDEAALTADVAWEHRLPYSYWGGSMVMLPNGNVEMNSSSAPPAGSRVVEVTVDQQEVWRMNVTNAAFYRAYRVGSLYPGVQW